MFRDKAAHDQVKCVSLKLSQGAKPGHRRGAAGGQGHRRRSPRPAASRRARSASARPRTGCSTRRASWSTSSPGCASWPTASRPASSSASATATSCWRSARRWSTEQITPDFIVVDGSEGGTGAAPLEYEDHVGTPLTDGLIMLHNALVGTGLRDRIKIGASGKVATGTDIVKRLVQGADYTNAARAMMMAVGCIQAQQCHTNTCPVGVATQDPRRAAGARRRRQDASGSTQLPAGHRRPGAADDRLARAGRPGRAAPGHADAPDRPRAHRQLRRALRLARARASCWPTRRRDWARRLGRAPPRHASAQTTATRRTDRMTTVAEMIVTALADQGVRTVWGVVGDALNPVTDAIRREDRIEWIGVRHEEVARVRRRRAGPADRHARRLHGHRRPGLDPPAQRALRRQEVARARCWRSAGRCRWPSWAATTSRRSTTTCCSATSPCSPGPSPRPSRRRRCSSRPSRPR